MYRKYRLPFVHLFVLLVVVATVTNKSRRRTISVSVDLPQLKAEGEITAVTLYSSTSYFQYKMQPMGYEYDLINDFAKSRRFEIKHQGRRESCPPDRDA